MKEKKLCVYFSGELQVKKNKQTHVLTIDFTFQQAESTEK